MKQRYVFNNLKWGGKDVGNNLQFWELADIVKEYRDPEGQILADVQWEDGTITHGHFVNSMLCARCFGKMRLDTGEWCPECAGEELT